MWILRCIAIALMCLSLNGCVGKIIGTTVDVATEAAKVPFKVGGAVVDVATGDDDPEPAEGGD